MAVKKKKIKVKRKIVKSESANAPFKSLIRVLKATKMIDCWSITNSVITKYLQILTINVTFNCL